VPLSPYQRELLILLSSRRTDERYLAGGAAMHVAPNSARISDDLDFFHDSEVRVAQSFAADRDLLESAGHRVEVELSLPGHVRAIVTRELQATRVDWAHDSAWRFMPLLRDEFGGLTLHPIDLCINKLLALAGRDEPRDFVDILYAHTHTLHTAGLAWAAVGKDPGFTPESLLELLRRRGRYRPEVFARLQLTEPFDLVAAKTLWLAALDETEHFVRSRPDSEYGALYYSPRTQRFAVPRDDESLESQGLVVHHGAPGGVLPVLS
jgi:hypothetical protein